MHTFEFYSHIYNHNTNMVNITFYVSRKLAILQQFFWIFLLIFTFIVKTEII